MTIDPRSLHVRVRSRLERHAESFTLDVDFEAPPGVTILFGPSGSGKSTTLRAIAGLRQPDSGCINLGTEVWYHDERRIDVAPQDRRVAFVFQSLALFPHMTAVGNVAYGIDRHVPREERRERAVELLDKLGVGRLAARRPHTFSGGEAQRVALARALAMSPKVVLLDEPFSALDRKLRIQLATLVRELVDELRLPLIQVTHNYGEARAMGDRVLRMSDGRIVARGGIEILDDDAPTPDEAPTPGSARGKRRYQDIGQTPMPELRRRRD